MVTTYVKGRLYKLQIAALNPDPKQARKFMDPIALNELTASIQKHGVLTPIQFTKNEEEALMIVCGHRRVKAAEKVGLAEIPGTFTDGDTRLQGFVENLQRETLLPVDEAEGMDTLMKEYALNRYQLAESLGKPTSSVYDTLSLNKLPADVRDACRTNPNIPKAMLLEVARQKSEGNMRRKFQTLMQKAAKTSQPRVLKEKLSTARSLITQTDKLSGELMNSPWSEWSEDDQNDYANALTGIRRTAGELLTSMNRMPMEGETESTQSDGPVLS